jgi:hypothetical protein
MVIRCLLVDNSRLLINNPYGTYWCSVDRADVVDVTNMCAWCPCHMMNCCHPHRLHVGNAGAVTHVGMSAVANTVSGVSAVAATVATFSRSGLSASGCY